MHTLGVRHSAIPVGNVEVVPGTDSNKFYRNIRETDINVWGTALGNF